MPFDDPEPLQMNWWVFLFLLIGLVKGIWDYLRFSKEHEENLKSDQEPYAGHYYERKQVKKML